MQSADEAFEPRKNKKSDSSGAGNWWWLLMLHSTWIILLVIGVWYGFTSWRFSSAGTEVPAVVIALDESYSDGSTTYSPVFEYQFEGQTYTYESVNSSSPPTHDIGERTTLLVDPENPKSARENSFWELWLLPVIMCPIAGIVAVVAIALTLFIKPWKRKA
jgi:hypothetical protein